MIGSVVRNRAWILQRHINAIKEQDVDFETCYVLNDSTDESEEILLKNGFSVVHHDLGKFKTESHSRGIGGYSFANLAEVRNVLLKKFLESNSEYLLSIDSDIIIPKDSIKQLIDSNLDICSMIIKNHPTLEAYNIMVQILGHPGMYRHVRVIGEGYVPVDITGAVYIIKREVIEKGVEYGFHNQGEDIYFCERAKELGYKIFCDTRLKPIHCYSEDGTQDLVVQ